MGAGAGHRQLPRQLTLRDKYNSLLYGAHEQIAETTRLRSQLLKRPHSTAHGEQLDCGLGVLVRAAATWRRGWRELEQL